MIEQHFNLKVDQVIRSLDRLNFLTEELNYHILKFLLEQSDGVSIKTVAERFDINKSRAKGRLQRFVDKYLCDVGIEIPKYETQRPTKSYTLIYMIKPHIRSQLNIFVDLIEEVCYIKQFTQQFNRNVEQ